ncbi:hypothetical protein EON68_01420 [archaeon]|nr:MAG: hypothetical protein EON68_01420 [archaeon]
MNAGVGAGVRAATATPSSPALHVQPPHASAPPAWALDAVLASSPATADAAVGVLADSLPPPAGHPPLHPDDASMRAARAAGCPFAMRADVAGDTSGSTGGVTDAAFNVQLPRAPAWLTALGPDIMSAPPIPEDAAHSAVHQPPASGVGGCTFLNSLRSQGSASSAAGMGAGANSAPRTRYTGGCPVLRAQDDAPTAADTPTIKSVHCITFRDPAGVEVMLKRCAKGALMHPLADLPCFYASAGPASTRTMRRWRRAGSESDDESGDDANTLSPLGAELCAEDALLDDEVEGRHVSWRGMLGCWRAAARLPNLPLLAVCIPTTASAKQCLRFWRGLGADMVSVFNEPYDWVLCSDGMVSLVFWPMKQPPPSTTSAPAAEALELVCPAGVRVPRNTLTPCLLFQGQHASAAAKALQRLDADGHASVHRVTCASGGAEHIMWEPRHGAGACLALCATKLNKDVAHLMLYGIMGMLGIVLLLFLVWLHVAYPRLSLPLVTPLLQLTPFKRVPAFTNTPIRY